MSEFKLYYQLGLEHILDLQGYDHILFVVALMAIYLLEDWKRILILVTAFTLGHSVTLALATLEIISVDTDLIEFLIPITILVTAVVNMFVKVSSTVTINYVFAAFFGLIHGLGFSNYLKSLLSRNSDIIMELFAFNVGLEVGQLVIVAIFLAVSFLFVTIFGLNHRDWKLVICAAVAGIALLMVLESPYLEQ